MSIFARIAAFFRSPHGRRALHKASAYAKSPEGRKQLQKLLETAKSRKPGKGKKGPGR